MLPRLAGLPVSRQSPVPLYRQLRNAIAESIADGELAPGARMSEQEIVAGVGVSRVTARGALDLLERDGLVSRVPGLGTFVREKKLAPITALTSFTENMRALGKVPSRRTLSVAERGASPAVALELGVEPGAEVLVVERLLKADGVPMAHMTARVPSWVYQKDRALWDTGHLDEMSFYYILESLLGITLYRSTESLDAQLTKMNISHFDMTGEAVFLMVHRRTYSDTDRPVESTRLQYRADLYRYEAELFRSPRPHQS